MEQRLRFFNNRMLRMLGCERDAENRERRILYNEVINELYSSTNVIWVKKSRSMRKARHIAQTGDRCANGFWWKNLVYEDHWKT
jgi:hypothetical protein